jgi:hypothetical protein
MQLQNHKAPIILLLGLLVTGYFLFDYLSGPATPTLTEVDALVDQLDLAPEEKAEIKKRAMKLVTDGQENSPAAKDLMDDILRSLPLPAAKYYGFGFRAGLEDVRFYGKVIDQYGEPVTNAKIKYSVGGRYLASGRSFSGPVSTDQDGEFLIEGEGGSVSIYGFKADNIQVDIPGSPGSEMKRQAIGFFGYQHTQGGNQPLWTDTSPIKPFVFPAWRIGEGEYAKKLLSRSIGEVLIADGRWYTINFLPREREEQFLEGESSAGQLWVSLLREEPQGKGEKKGSWKMTMKAVGGGLQAVEGRYSVMAPAEGYENEAVLEQDINSPGYISEISDKYYFIKAAEGEMYGVFNLNVYPYANGNESVFGIDGAFNTKGSRSLVTKRN